MVGINLDGFSLANRLRFAKFAKLSRYTVYSIAAVSQLRPQGRLTLLNSLQLRKDSLSLINAQTNEQLSTETLKNILTIKMSI